MKTPNANKNTLTREWFIVDVSDAVVGRIATKIASILRGKHKPIFTPHVDVGDFIVVINAERIRFTGNKEIQKKYFRHTGYVGSSKTVTAELQRELHPERIIIAAVRGMLPKGPLGRTILKKLKVYKGKEHPHLAQNPKVLNF